MPSLIFQESKTYPLLACRETGGEKSDCPVWGHEDPSIIQQRKNHLGSRRVCGTKYGFTYVVIRFEF